MSTLVGAICLGWAVLAACLLYMLMRMASRNSEEERRHRYQSTRQGQTLVIHRGDALPPEIRTRSQVRERKARMN